MVDHREPDPRGCARQFARVPGRPGSARPHAVCPRRRDQRSCRGSSEPGRIRAERRSHSDPGRRWGGQRDSARDRPAGAPLGRRRRGEGAGLRGVFRFAPLDQETTLITARVVAAMTAAGVVSLPLGVNRAYWVIMVAGAVLQASHVRRLTVVRTIQRVLGKVAGVTAFALLTWLQPSGLWLVAVLALLQFAIEVVVGRNYGLALIFITPLALTISAATGTDDPFRLAGERIGDTLLGALIALVVLWISERFPATRPS